MEVSKATACLACENRKSEHVERSETVRRGREHLGFWSSQRSGERTKDLVTCDRFSPTLLSPKAPSFGAFDFVRSGENRNERSMEERNDEHEPACRQAGERG
ncbi:TPA: hypothetical protein DCP88_00465 [Candidatus Campbellbacteria bacterium]|nr:hypothetical protein [Candidatus Campbellbacteria bacterium]HAQ02131.1 hypothetical protein [Candidatus Campbellbacteria bacterium]